MPAGYKKDSRKLKFEDVDHDPDDPSDEQNF